MTFPATWPGVIDDAAIFLELGEERLHKLACCWTPWSCNQFTLLVIKLVAVHVEKAVAPVFFTPFLNIMGEKLTFGMVLADCLTVRRFCDVFNVFDQVLVFITEPSRPEVISAGRWFICGGSIITFIKIWSVSA